MEIAESGKKASILDMLETAKKGMENEVNFILELPNEIKLNCTFRKSDALRLPEEDRLVYETKLLLCEKRNIHLRPINEEEWKIEFDNQVKLMIEANDKKAKDDRVNISEYKKRLEKQKPLNRAEQVAKDLAKMALLSDVIPKLIRIEGKHLDEEEQISFADLITSDTSVSKKVIDEYVKLTELFNKQTTEAKN